MFKNVIAGALARTTDWKAEEIHLETPEREEFGDYSSNVAMQLFSQNKEQSAKNKDKNQSLITNYQSPLELAEEIVNKLNADKKLQEVVEKIEVAGAGFINFWLKREVLINELQTIISSGDDYGKSSAFSGKKIMVEYAHPNTHKELHIGHMRTLILGEALSRIFGFTGAEVFRANYQGDIGPHVAKAIWGTRKLLKDRGLKWENAEDLGLSDKAHLLGKGYVLANREYEENKKEIDALNTKIYEKDPEVIGDYQRTRRWSLEYYDSFYTRFGTKFDKLYFESEIADNGKEIVLNNLGKVFEESEGAIIFNAEKYGLHKRVFVTKDNNPTYEAKDMALAPKQYSDFPFDLNVHVVANEQKEYFRVIFKALELIDEKFKDREYHLPMGMVNLVGRKMSSRMGDVYTVEQLLDDVKSLVVPLIRDRDLSQDEKDNIAEQVTVAAVKYSMLKVNPEADVAFDIKQSVHLEGDSGPYIQYTFARTQSVLRKGNREQGISEAWPTLSVENRDNYENLDMNSEELSLLRTYIRFSDVILMSAKNYSPNMLCNYLYDLAQKFNLFYQKHRIIDERALDNSNVGNSKKEKLIPSPYSLVPNFRLTLTAATSQILKNGLDLLGIQVPERM